MTKIVKIMLIDFPIILRVKLFDGRTYQPACLAV